MQSSQRGRFTAPADQSRRCKSQCCFCLRGKFLTFFVSVSRIIIIFKNMSLVIIISPFFFCCCVFRGRGRAGAPCSKKLRTTRRTLTPRRCSREKVYLAAHVLLLSRVVAVMSVGLVMDGGQSEEARDR